MFQGGIWSLSSPVFVGEASEGGVLVWICEENEGWPLSENADDWDGDDWEWLMSLPETSEDESLAAYWDEFVEQANEPAVSWNPRALSERQATVEPDATNTVAESDWHYDDSGYYAYITLNGSREALQHHMAVLEKHGYECRRFEQSFRPANNGRRYDWYIRICRHDDSKPTRDELLKALGPLVRKSVTPTRQDVELLQRKMTRMEAANRQLADQVERVEAEARSLREQLLDTRAERSNLENDKAVLQSEVERLKEEIEERWDLIRWYSDRLYRMRTHREQKSEFRSQLESLTQQNREQSERLRHLSSRLAGLAAQEEAWEQEQQEFRELLQIQDDEIRTLKNRLAMVTAERDELLDAGFGWSQAVDDADEQGSYSGDLQPGTLAMLLSMTLPSIEFVNGSFDFIARELPDPRRCLRELYLLNSADVDGPRGERVESTRNWRERRFPTGQSNAGRIYFRRLSGGKVRVLVSDKKNQNLDIRRLQSDD